MGTGVARFLRIFSAALAVGLLTASQAAAAGYSGQIDDPAGDGPEAGRDLTSVRVGYDSESGRYEATIRFSGPPSAGQQVAVGIGRRDQSGTCSVPLLVLGTVLYDDFTVWLREENGESPAEADGEATREASGSALTLEATDPAMAGLSPDCAEAVSSDAADTSVTYDQTDTFVVSPPPRKPRLSASIAGTGPLEPGATRTIKVKVINAGNAAARATKLRLTGRGPASLKPRLRALGSIAPGKSRTAKFRLKASRRAKGKVSLNAKVTSRGATATAKAKVPIRRPKRPAPPAKGGLSGKIFWGLTPYRFDRSPDIVFLHFAGPRFVRWGMSKGGLKSCHRVTAKVKDGEMRPGCLRYSFSKRSGKVRIGKATGTYRRGKLKLKMDDGTWSTDGKSWYAALVAKPGTRFQTKLINRGFYGACGITPYCTTWAENLTLSRDGRFGRQESSLSTGGGGGLPFVAISRLGPDERGRYRVLAGGRIVFKYASGKTSTETLVVQADKRGRPDPVREGLLIDDVWFYREDD